ncbi:MAG: DUF5106 domain-containing protein [Muribaculum sp.]|nr:DUF5106 domain-containing protein [Muribaculaceae bacterium]MCM1081471.1 DUF5106 domain-containing protein [Muribaculum sp.]
MKRISHIISIAIFSAVAFCNTILAEETADSSAVKMPETPFEYPMAPDSLSTLQARTSYVMLRFWDKADMKKIMADTALFNKAFHDFTTFVPYSHPDSIKKSISNLVAKLGDKPENLLQMARRAEAELYGPEAEFWSETTYIMFLRPVLNNKKVKNKDKEYYLAQITKLNSSQVGSSFPTLTYQTRNDAKHSMSDFSSKFKYVLFQPADCSDCSFTRLRLEADGATSMLSEDGRLKIFIIAPEKTDAAWRESMKNYPYTWEIGSCEDAPELVDLRVMPRIYVLDENNRIIARDLTIEQLLSFSTAIYSSPTETASEPNPAQ